MPLKRNPFTLAAFFILLGLWTAACAALPPAALPSPTHTSVKLPAGQGNSTVPPTSAPTIIRPTPALTVAPTRVPPTEIPTLAPTAATLLATPTIPAQPASATNLPATTTSDLAILAFSVVPTKTLALGDILHVEWKTRGKPAVLCPYILTPAGPSEPPGTCVVVPPQGSRNISVTAKDLNWSGLLLRVKTGTTTERALVRLVLGCRGFRDWFFRPLPPTCPEDKAIRSPAVAQRFEHGLVVWMQNPERFYAFYDTDQDSGMFEWATGPFSFQSGASPDNRIGETPPAGRYEPEREIGELWRGEVEGLNNFRARLGWGTAPQADFETAYQCELRNPAFRLWSCFLQLPDGKVLRLNPDSTAQVHFVWQVVK